MAHSLSSLMGRSLVLLGAAAFALSGASAQSSTSLNTASASESSSSSTQLMAFDGLGSGLALPAAPAPAAGGAAGGQENGNGNWHHDPMHNLTFEAGGGFNAPVGNDTPYIDWGGNFTVGAGLRFSNRISALLEYQYIDDKLPGPFLYAEGVYAGNSHINSITVSPVIDLFPKRSNGVYLVGGYGYYHKSTNFQDYEEVESFYGVYDEPVTVASVTSNQMGGNLGFGLYHRFGGFLGEGHTQLFAEARYTYIHTPQICQSCTTTPGFGTTELIPVTMGFRF